MSRALWLKQAAQGSASRPGQSGIFAQILDDYATSPYYRIFTNEEVSTLARTTSLSSLTDDAATAAGVPGQTLKNILEATSSPQITARINANIDADPAIARRLLQEGAAIAGTGLSSARYLGELNQFRRIVDLYPDLYDDFDVVGAVVVSAGQKNAIEQVRAGLNGRTLDQYFIDEFTEFTNAKGEIKDYANIAKGAFAEMVADQVHLQAGWVPIHRNPVDGFSIGSLGGPSQGIDHVYLSTAERASVTRASATIETKSGINQLGTTDGGDVDQMSTTWLSDQRWETALGQNQALVSFSQSGERVLAKVSTSGTVVPDEAHWSSLMSWNLLSSTPQLPDRTVIGAVWTPR